MSNSFQQIRWMYSCALLLCAFGLLSACHSANNPPPSTAVSETSTGSNYILSGGAKSPGSHLLHPGDTVQTIIIDNLPGSPGHPITVVLIRSGPDGKTRQFIELNSKGKLVDENQNYTLRDGDELMFPYP